MLGREITSPNPTAAPFELFLNHFLEMTGGQGQDGRLAPINEQSFQPYTPGSSFLVLI
jgi:hypothetical protein